MKIVTKVKIVTNGLQTLLVAATLATAASNVTARTLKIAVWNIEHLRDGYLIVNGMADSRPYPQALDFGLCDDLP